MEEKKVYVIVDYMKMFAAAIVVLGHCYMADVPGLEWFTGLVKAVVQTFFVFNGYFLVKNKTLHQQEKMKRYVRHFLELILLWVVIYYFWNMLFTDHGDGWFYQYSLQTAQWFCGLNSGHLWYVQNLLLTVLLLYFTDKKSFSGKEALAATLLAGIMGGNLFRAWAGVGFGIYLAQREEKKGGADAWKTAAYSLAGIAGFFLMVYAYQQPGAITWDMLRESIKGTGALLAGMLLAIAAIAADNCLYRKKICLPDSSRIRKSSSIVYFVHLMFVPAAMVFVKYLLVQPGILTQGGLAWSLVVGGITLAAGILLGILIPVLARQKAFLWLKKLY